MLVICAQAPCVDRKCVSALSNCACKHAPGIRLTLHRNFLEKNGSLLRERASSRLWRKENLGVLGKRATSSAGKNQTS